MKAIIAVEHGLLIATWNMLTIGEFYRDPGADYITRWVPAKTKGLGNQLTNSKHSATNVTLQPLAATA
jgi:transposase